MPPQHGPADEALVKHITNLLQEVNCSAQGLADAIDVVNNQDDDSQRNLSFFRAAIEISERKKHVRQAQQPMPLNRRDRNDS